MAGSPELQEAVYSKEPAASILELNMARENRFYHFLKGERISSSPFSSLSSSFP